MTKVLHRDKVFEEFDASAERIDLSGLSGRVELTVYYDEK
jgi:hypothetical protein